MFETNHPIGKKSKQHDDLPVVKKRVSELEKCLSSRAEIDAAISESEHKFQKIANAAGDMIHLNDHEGHIIYANPATEKLLGYSPEEIKEYHPVELIHPDDGIAVSMQIAANLHGEPAPAIEFRIKKKDGTYLDVEGTGFSINLDGHEPVVGAILRDITKRKRAERKIKQHQTELEKKVEERTKELRNSNKALKKEIEERKKVEKSLKESETKHRQLYQEFHALLDAVPDLLSFQSPDLMVKWANRRVVDLLNLQPDQIIGRKCYSLWFDREEPCPHCPVLRCFESGRIESQEITTGKGKIFDMRACPIKNESGDVTGVIAISRNITLQKKIEDELIKSQKLDSVEIMASGIAHNFNNILTAILGNISLAEISCHDASLKDLLVSIKTAAKRAKDLTAQLLTFSKSGTPIRKISALDRLIQKTADFALSGSNINCVISAEDDLWPVYIDESQISLALQNIINNGVQGMPGGGTINVDCRNFEVQESDPVPLRPEKYVHIIIADEGEGIPNNQMDKIFDPNSTITSNKQGLGLATAYSIIKQHNGQISVESNMDHGTTFHVYLPVAEQESTLRNNEEEIKTVPSNKKILVMDDENMVRNITVKVLEKLGYEVIEARDGNEAAAIYKKEMEEGTPFGLVILDLTIPGGIGGEETLKLLQRIDPQVTAIASSGYTNDPIMTDFGEHGFKEILPKPYSIKILQEKIDSIFKGRPRNSKK